MIMHMVDVYGMLRRQATTLHLTVIEHALIVVQALNSDTGEGYLLWCWLLVGIQL